MRLSIVGAGNDEGDAFVRLLSEHWEDLFEGQEEEGEEEGQVRMLDPEALLARIEEGKQRRARRCVGCLII